MSTENPLAAHAARLLNDTALSCERLQGGSLSDVLRLRLASGKDVVVKSGPGPAQEGRMLHALLDAGMNVPKPMIWDDDVVILEDLGPAAPPTDRGWRALGARLRALHGTTGRRYGWDEDFAFGAVRIDNRWTSDWARFWFEQRLMADCDVLPVDLARRLETLEPRTCALVPAQPLPRLLHGDLWSGNVHFSTDGMAYLLDPAAYFGDAEVDLAMLTLFGSPPPAFWAGYGDLDEGWPRRRALYQLWPALVHLRLFGASYRGLVERLIAEVEA
ncbi:MAG: fructosamine kinase family protein [Pseudomonadota bacterium]